MLDHYTWHSHELRYAPRVRAEINLSPDARAARLRAAVFALAVTLAFMVALSELAVGARWWAMLAIPLFGVSTMVVQAYTGVCPNHSRHGTRATCGGSEVVLDPAKRSSLAARGRRVMFASLAIGLTATGLVVALAALR
jgi:hypothetical protein